MATFTWPWSRRERFGEFSIGDPAFAAWLRGATDAESEIVNASTVLGISAVLRSVSVISTTIADLPLRTYERRGDDRAQIPSVFDDPYPGEEGMTPFAWVETVLIHLLLWRNAYLWNETRDRGGFISSYRPLLPDVITKVEVKAGRKVFTYRDPDTQQPREVGTEMITHIPGPSLDGHFGHPFLSGARAIFSAAISGDKAAQKVLRRGIRVAGLVTPADGEEVDPTESEEILNKLRAEIVGSDNAGDIAFVNRRLKLDPWTPTNVESQWDQTRKHVLGEVGRLFGIPPHLLNDTEKQTSWGTGVAEQNLGLARYTLKGWSTRIEQAFTRKLPRGQFVEFDYKGLLQGTPADEIQLILDQMEGGLITRDEGRKILNLPPLTAKQRRELDARPVVTRTRVRPTPLPVRQEATA